MPTDLANRMYEYLRKQDDWVGKGTLSSLALSHGYTAQNIIDTYYNLKDRPDIGVLFTNGDERNGSLAHRPRGEYFRWYDMAEEEKEAHYQRMEVFHRL